MMTSIQKLQYLDALNLVGQVSQGFCKALMFPGSFLHSGGLVSRSADCASALRGRRTGDAQVAYAQVHASVQMPE
jgi:hypothetical protein